MIQICYARTYICSLLYNSIIYSESSTPAPPGQDGDRMWQGGQPNYNQGFQGCLALNRGSTTGGYELTDETCSSRTDFYYICQYDES